MKTIYDFKKGDEIVRIQPAKPYREGESGDRSYMGDKLIFVGITNGQIYCQRTDDLSLKMFGDKLLDLALDIWDDGWDLFIDPKKLLEGFEPEMDKQTIENQIEKAIENEDYELAEKLKSKLFSVHTYSIVNEDSPMYAHWSEGLKMVIIKDGVKLKLNSEEIEQLVKTHCPCK